MKATRGLVKNYEASMVEAIQECEQQRKTIERLRLRIKAMNLRAKEFGLTLGIEESWMVEMAKMAADAPWAKVVAGPESDSRDHSLSTEG